MLILLVVKIILPLWVCQWATKIIYILSFRINVSLWYKLRICHWYYRLLRAFWTLRILNTVELMCILFKRLDILRFISYVACVHTVYTNIIFLFRWVCCRSLCQQCKRFLVPSSSTISRLWPGADAVQNIPFQPN